MRKFAALGTILLGLTLGALGQSNTTGTLNGIVLDPSGASIPGAAVTVTDTGTQQVFHLQSDIGGRFVVSNLSPGSYDVSVSHAGFTTGTYRTLQIVVGQIYALKAALKLGSTGQTVEVQAGQQVIDTQQTAVGDQVTGAQITQVPITSRNTQDLSLMEPGTQTGPSPRQSQFNGLPPGALNITFDGINSQDNLLKSTTGSSFFSIEQPRVDDVQEFTISQAANDASATGEGAVQIGLVSNKGKNAFHGGAWEYLRNDALNANYYFNNLNNLPRQRLRLNEFGGKLGGYLIKNKLFFFVDNDFFVNPNAVLRQRAVLTQSAATGKYTYTPAAGSLPGTLPNWLSCSGTTCTADLFAMAAANGQNGTPDATMQKIVSEMAAATTAPGVSLGKQTNFNSIPLLFNSNAQSNTQYPDIRLDYNINNTNSLEFDYHYSHYNAEPDLLNSSDESYPVAPFNTNVGGQISNRSLMAVAWRDQVTPTINNELRVGGNSSPVWFDQGAIAAIYPQMTSNLGTTFVRPIFNNTFNSLLMTNPFNSYFPQSRNVALAQVIDTLGWLHGNHSFTMGTNITGLRYKQTLSSQPVANLNLGESTLDPALGMFTTTSGTGNLPGMGSRDLLLAENLYGVLAGNITGFNQRVNVNPTTRKYEPGFNNLRQISQKELGVFFSDNWRMSPTLNFNYGLRWEWEGTPTDDLNEYYVANGAFGQAGLWGVSGVNNLFQPGNMPGAVTTLLPDTGAKFYNSYKKDFAPSLGLAWTPQIHGGILGAIFGSNGQSVFRGGYAIAYDREGLNFFSGQITSNPGATNNGFLTPSLSNGPAGSGLFQAGTLQFQNGNFGSTAGGTVAAGQEESLAFGQPLSINPSFGDQINAFNPNLRPPMIQSWSLGIQRQLNSNTAIEIRYVGNHGTHEWNALNLNEANIFENKFLTEFNGAIANLAACNNNQAACKAAAGVNSTKAYSNFGALLPGDTLLPIMTAAFNKTNSGSQTAAQFTSGSFISDLNTGQAGALANAIASNFTDWTNLKNNGQASNTFWTNPDASGGAFLLTDPNQSTYNAFQVEVRRRMAAGLQFNGNYTWSHSLSTGNIFTLRDIAGAEAPTGSDLRHALKFENLWELPFGNGHRWKSGSDWVNRTLGGWEWDGILRWQSGAVFQITGGASTNTPQATFNQNDGGVNLIGTNVGAVQSQLAVAKGNGVVFFSPNSLLGANQQGSNAAILAPCTTPGKFCQMPYVYGPSFFEADWALVKNIQINERWKLVLRANALDAFNNINFQTPSGNNSAVQSSSFMQLTNAYQDFNSSQYPGGRVIELQGRIVF